MVWQSDFSFEDYGLEEDGIVAVLYCHNCGTIAEFYTKLEETGEQEMKKKMILNPNKKIVESICKRLEITGGYCPCIPEQNEDTICPCKDFRENQYCHCTLYVEDTEGI
ncbi:hypothetical protein SDC9_124469 [bioreactor metagenome]|uniref:Uncharacterized protein n=1 Tax=bioreactor metagenome TaxID=1076179 RepID=A0A645CKH3_9ZZZZ